MRGSRFNIRLEDETSSETRTMAEFRWIKTSLFLILLLQFTAAKGQRVVSFTVRVGDEVTLPCNCLMDDQENCNSTEWLFYNSRKRTVVVLAQYGKIVDEAKDKTDRLNVSKDGSLVIKKVTDEDAGLYNCRQFRSGRVPDAVVYLSVVTLTEHKDAEEVTVICSVSSYDGCRHTVKWLLQGQDVDKDNKEVMTSQSSCSASLKFLTSHFFNTLRFNSLMCEVTDGDEVKKFPLRKSPSGDEAGEDTTTTTTEDTTSGWWRFISVSAGLAALIIIVVAVNIWARIKEKRNQTDETAVRYDAEDETVNYENIRPPDGV